MIVIANRPKKVTDITVSDITYTCLSCGTTYKKQDGNFFKSTWSQLWNYNNKYLPVCKSCMDKMFKDYSTRYNSDKTALLIACHYLDVPFYNSLYDSIVVNNSNFSIGMYSRQILNNRQYQYKTFVNTLVDGELGKSQEEIVEERETKWTKRDIQNKNRIVSSVLKYDPFEDYNDLSRKFMFNLASDYLSDEETINDPHKLQGVIEIVKMYQQVDTVNKQVLLETNNPSINEQRFKTLTAIKKDLLDSINKFAKDNGISASLSNKGNKGSSSLAYHIKTLDEMKFTESQISLYDLVTCESFRQFADISNENILKQIHLNSDELGDMMEIQTKTIQNNKLEIMKLKEENRLLKIKLSENNISYLIEDHSDASIVNGDA